MNKEFKFILDNLSQSKQETLHINSRVLIVDSMNTFLRSFVMIKHMNPVGNHIGGLTGFLKSIGFAIKQIKPTRVILVFDGMGGSTNKKNIYPEYKANRKLTRISNWDGFESREDESESITNQIIRLIDYLKCLPVDLISIDKVEADDVIGYIAGKLEEQVFIMSTDNDFLQLASDRVTIYSPIKKRFYRYKDVFDQYGVSPQNYLNYKILLGDNSDNVPGVRGIGPKTALKLFPEFTQKERIPLNEIIKKSYDLVDEQRLYGNIYNFRHQLNINEKLMNLLSPIIPDTDILEIEETLENPKQSMDRSSFLEMYTEDQLGKSINNPQIWLHDVFNYLKYYEKK